MQPYSPSGRMLLAAWHHAGNEDSASFGREIAWLLRLEKTNVIRAQRSARNGRATCARGRQGGPAYQ